VRPINLLPPEVAEERTRRRRSGLVIVAAIAYVVLLAAGVFYWNTRVSAARAEVDAQDEINATLQGEVTSLADAGLLQAEFAARADLVRGALVNDVDWGIFLNDLARLLPPRVWVESFSGTVPQFASAEIVGEVSFNGVGFDFPDISAWLRALGSEAFAGLTGPWVSTASESAIGEESVVTFSSTAVLTAAAVTDRAVELIPEVP
jgi:Tfp pilus assembly protein PilN